MRGLCRRSPPALPTTSHTLLPKRHPSTALCFPTPNARRLSSLPSPLPPHQDPHTPAPSTPPPPLTRCPITHTRPTAQSPPLALRSTANHTPATVLLHSPLPLTARPDSHPEPPPPPTLLSPQAPNAPTTTNDIPFNTTPAAHPSCGDETLFPAAA